MGYLMTIYYSKKKYAALRIVTLSASSSTPKANEESRLISNDDLTITIPEKIGPDLESRKIDEIHSVDMNESVKT